MRVLEPKSTVLSHAKKRHFFGPKKCFFGRPTGRRGPPRKHSVKTYSGKGNMMKNTSGKIPQKSDFFWNFVLHRLWRVRKNAIISHKVDSQNIVVFSTSEAQKTAKIRPPPRRVRRHNQNMYPRKGKMSSGEIPKKVRFFGIFRN